VELNNLKVVLINPTHHHGKTVPKSMIWTNDSFDTSAKLFGAKLYHILDEDIDRTADLYYIINFDINLIDKEIEFATQMKQRGAKILVSYSQDVRFLHGGGLWNSKGFIYTDLCEVADMIVCGISQDIKIYGRYQDKVIQMGEIIEDNDFSIPYEERDIDLLTSGAIGEECLGFELEFLSLIKQKFPEKRVVSIIHSYYGSLIDILRKKYPLIEFPNDGTSFINYLQRAKVYCNPELRPRSGRSLVEAYYCRTPFISSSMMYHSKMCPNFTYNSSSIVDWVNIYELLINSNYKDIVFKMEEVAKFDMFENVYKRILEKIRL